MKERVIGKRYARALLGLAKEQSKVQEIADSLSEVVDAYQSSQELRSLFLDPKITKEKKTSIFSSLLEKINPEKLVKTFCLFLIHKKRIDLIVSINQVFSSMVDDFFNRECVEIVVPTKMTPDQQEKIRAELSAFLNKEVVLTEKEDPAIIGGAITRIRSIVLDGSIRNQLNILKETILKG